MRGRGPAGYLALSLCIPFDIDVLLFANTLIWLAIEISRSLGSEGAAGGRDWLWSVAAAPKCRADLSDKVLAQKLDRILTGPSDWNGWFGFGAASGTGWVTGHIRPDCMVERDEDCMSSEARVEWHRM
jgi:hypothetical protein